MPIISRMKRALTDTLILKPVLYVTYIFFNLTYIVICTHIIYITSKTLVRTLHVWCKSYNKAQLSSNIAWKLTSQMKCMAYTKHHLKMVTLLLENKNINKLYTLIEVSATQSTKLTKNTVTITFSLNR